MHPIILNTFENRPVKLVQPSFKGVNTFEAVMREDMFKLSFKNQKYVVKASNLVEDTWKQIRNNEILSDCPNFLINCRRMPAAHLQPIYGSTNSELLLEIPNGKYSERIFLNRKYPSEFRYEKIVTTDYGSATLKYYDSRTHDNKELAEDINQRLEKYLSKLFPPNPLTKYYVNRKF